MRPDRLRGAASPNAKGLGEGLYREVSMLLPLLADKVFTIRGGLVMVRPRQIGLNRDSLIQRQLGIAPVAQLDRASDYGSEGQEFESSRARQVSIARTDTGSARCKP